MSILEGIKRWWRSIHVNVETETEVDQPKYKQVYKATCWYCGYPMTITPTWRGCRLCGDTHWQMEPRPLYSLANGAVFMLYKDPDTNHYVVDVNNRLGKNVIDITRGRYIDMSPNTAVCKVTVISNRGIGLN